MKDEKYIHMTHILAEKGRGTTSPNPMVGAVVVRGNEILAKSYHKIFGGSHAEVIALHTCGDQARGATLYVSLEPCCHYGKTPPCTDLIVRSGIKRVVCSTLDPNPLVNGKGIRRLRKAGIEVDVGILEEEAIKLNEAYFKYITTRIPFVTLKVAGTLNGKVAAVHNGVKFPSTDAVLFDVDRHTHPRLAPLSCRETITGTSNPKIILWGGWDNVSKCLRKLKADDHRHIILALIDVKSANIGSNGKYKVWKISKRKNGEFDLLSFLKKCGKEEITSLLVEGGNDIFTSFLKQKLVDKIRYEVSLEVSSQDKELFGDLGIKKMSDAVVLKNCEWKQSGNKMMAVGYTGF